MSGYPPLTKEEFAHFLNYEENWGKIYGVPMPLITSPLTRRVRRGLHDLFTCKWYGWFGYEKNREEALKHYDKACIYDPKIKEMHRTRTTVEAYRKEQLQ